MHGFSMKKKHWLLQTAEWKADPFHQACPKMSDRDRAPIIQSSKDPASKVLEQTLSIPTLWLYQKQWWFCIYIYNIHIIIHIYIYTYYIYIHRIISIHRTSKRWFRYHFTNVVVIPAHYRLQMVVESIWARLKIHHNSCTPKTARASK